MTHFTEQNLSLHVTTRIFLMVTENRMQHQPYPVKSNNATLSGGLAFLKNTVTHQYRIYLTNIHQSPLDLV